MANKIGIFIEGNDDSDFFEKIIQPVLEEQGYEIQLIKYRELNKKTVNTSIDFINSNLEEYLSYIFIHDFDENIINDRSSEQIIRKKKALQRTYSSLSLSNIYFIIKMIEGWYLAGLSQPITHKPNLDISEIEGLHFIDISKRKFKRIARKAGYEQPKFFYIDILNSFNFEHAINHNCSINFFYQKFCINNNFCI